MRPDQEAERRERTSMDGERFEREVIAMLPELYATALRFSCNVTDAEDLVADTVAKAWSAIAALQDPGRFRAWSLRILTNTFYAGRRARAARPRMGRLPFDGGDDFSLFEELYRPSPFRWGDPELQFLDRLLRKDLERAIDALPDPYKPVFVFADVQGLTYAEIARILDVPIGTVRSRLARGRALLQRALWEHGRDAGLVRSDPGVKRASAP